MRILFSAFCSVKKRRICSSGPARPGSPNPCQPPTGKSPPTIRKVSPSQSQASPQAVFAAAAAAAAAGVAVMLVCAYAFWGLCVAVPMRVSACAFLLVFFADAILRLCLFCLCCFVLVLFVRCKCYAFGLLEHPRPGLRQEFNHNSSRSSGRDSDIVVVEWLPLK